MTEDDRVATFIKGFFGPGNTVWESQKLDSDDGRRVLPYLEVLWKRESTEVPIVLPRRREKGGGELTAYVIARDAAHAVVVADLLTAFVGPSYSYFNGLPARLDPADPVEQAIREFVGDSLTFKVSSPTRQTQAAAWRALNLLQETWEQRPMRTWHVRKPIGRLLGEFEVALAAGDNTASADLLEQLTAVGGLSPANLAHLKIKRLARLGLDTELLRLPGLADVVLAGPPAPIRDAILAAIYGSMLAAALEAGDLAAARQGLMSAGALVTALLSGGLAGLSGESLAVVALAASMRQDAPLLASVMRDPQHHQQVARVAPLIANALTSAPDIPVAMPQDLAPVQATARLEEVTSPRAGSVAEETFRSAAGLVTSGPSESKVSEPGEAAANRPRSWMDLVWTLSTGTAGIDVMLDGQDWHQWDPPVQDDQAIANVLAGLDDQAADRAWSMVGPFVDADGYDQPAARTARQLIEIALLNDRFSPGDLAGVSALTEIFLRSAPGANDYKGLLDDLGAEANRWAGPDRASVVLDLADLLARSACPDEDAQLRLAIALLRPLSNQLGRLEPDQARFAQQLSSELKAELDWPTLDNAESDDALPNISPTKVLLYSLDEGVLERTKVLLGDLTPKADVRLAHDKVGSPKLKQQARGADVIVLATRCAKHAATGFIRAHAPATSLVTEADGSGSASLLRATIEALQARVAQ